MKISEKIVSLRKRMGWSQEDLANELDVSRQSVYKWESDLAVPEINKIKKMVELFGVSFDLLLNDDIDIESDVTETKDKEPKVNKKESIKYREVYFSENKLTEKQADLEHSSSYSLSVRKAVMEKDMREYGADFRVNLQEDLAACFFHNSKNMTFGFYFNGAIQFICPVENYISHYLSNSGLNPLLFSELTIGLWRMPVNSKPGRYDLTISYFNGDGHASEYNLSLYSIRDYLFKQYESPSGSVATIDRISIQTDKNLSNICSKLGIFPTLAKRIHRGEIEVNNTSVEKEKAVNHNKDSINEKFEAAHKEERRRRMAILKEQQELEKTKWEEKAKKHSPIGCLLAIVISILVFFLFFGGMF